MSSLKKKRQIRIDYKRYVYQIDKKEGDKYLTATLIGTAVKEFLSSD